MSKNVLKDLVNTRAVLREKLKNIKLNEIDKVNMLEDTFQPITKPLKSIISKLDDYDHQSLKSYNETVKKVEPLHPITKPLKSIISELDDHDHQSLKSHNEKVEPLHSMSSSSDYRMAYDDTNYDKSDFIDISANRDYENGEEDEDDDEHTSSFSNPDNHKLVTSTPISENSSLKKFHPQNLSTTSPSSSPLVENIKLLMRNDMLDKVYGFNIDQSGKWRYGTNKLTFHKDNTLYIGDMKIKMTPGLFELLFHSKPLHYSKIDLEKYKNIITTTNVHKRNYQSNKQIKGTKAFKYQRVIKKLLNTKSNISKSKGSGLSLKSVVVGNSKPNYIYWDDPNELVNRLRLLLSSEGVGHNNHKNEIISIIEELREANIIY